MDELSYCVWQVGRPKPVVGVLKNGETGPPMATVSVGFLGVPTRSRRERCGRARAEECSPVATAARLSVRVFE